MAGVLDARGALAEVTSILMGHFGAELRGLYLFGSLAAGGFRPGRSDIDLLAVLSYEVREGEPLETLRSLHDDFASRHPEWLDRIEVGYISHAVLQSFGDVPVGRVAVISPGEALNVKDVEANWLIDWYGVCTIGETLDRTSPTGLGPAVTKDAYLGAVQEHLGAWKEHVRQSWVEYVPAHRGIHRRDSVPRALHARKRKANHEGASCSVGSRTVSGLRDVHQPGFSAVPRGRQRVT